MEVSTATDPGLCNGLADSFASGEGLEDALFLNPTMLFQVDEMDTLINSMKSKDSRAEGLIEKMLRIFTASAGSYKLRNRSIPRAELNKMREQQKNGLNITPSVIHCPYLVIFGTAIPQFFYQALDQRLLANGLVARCLILDAGERGQNNKARLIRVPQKVIRTVKQILSYGGEGNLTSVIPNPIIIQATEEAADMMDALDEKYDKWYRKYEKTKAQVPMAFWARAFEKVCKLSMLYAISAHPDSPCIDKDAIQWASDFVEFLTKQALYLTHSFSFENPFDEKCQKALRYIRDAGGFCGHGALLKRMHESREVFKQIIETLKENGSITETNEPTDTKTGRVYHLVE